MSSMKSRTWTRALVAERGVVDLHPLVLVGARLMHDRRQPPARIQHAHHARGQLVDGVRALAAAQDQDEPPPGRRASAAARSIKLRRTGLPVKRTLRRANARAASSNATNTRRANRPSMRLVKPGTLFCS